MTYEKTNEYLAANPNATATEACKKTGYNIEHFYARRSKDKKRGIRIPQFKSSEIATKRMKPNNQRGELEVRHYPKPNTKMYNVQAVPLQSASRLTVVIGTNPAEVAELVRNLQQ